MDPWEANYQFQQFGVTIPGDSSLAKVIKDIQKKEREKERLMKTITPLDQFREDLKEFLSRTQRFEHDLRIIDFEFRMRKDNPDQWQKLLDSGYEPLHLKPKGEN